MAVHKIVTESKSKRFSVTVGKDCIIIIAIGNANIFSSLVTQIENVSSFVFSNLEKLLCFFNYWVYVYLW